MGHMPFFRKVSIVSIFALLGLFGCDQQRISELEEGVSTEADVRARFGEPEKIWDGEGAVRIFEYSRQPNGTDNYMISIGADGKMSALRQVLTPRNFEKVVPGMMMEDVRKMLGRPAKVTTYALKNQTHYDWHWMDPPTSSKLFTVVFNSDMRVVSSGSTDYPMYEGGK